VSNKPPSSPTPGKNEKEGPASILTDLQGTGAAEETPVMPDLGGIGTTSTKSKYKVHTQTLVIALVLLASGGALYLMRKQGMGAGIKFTPPKIDYDMEKASRPADDQHAKQVLDDLESSQNPANLPSEKIQKNPFQLDPHAATVTGAAPGDPDLIRQAQEAAKQAQRQKDIQAALASIEVNAIMEGQVPLARINGKIVREGEMVAEFFKVKEIHDRSVDLEADGKLYSVNMAENTGGGGPPKPRQPAPKK
jgi:hypothetical protein